MKTVFMTYGGVLTAFAVWAALASEPIGAVIIALGAGFSFGTAMQEDE